MATSIQPSFSAGELGPSVYGRVDIARYQTGLKTALNVIVRPGGGVANRSGLQYIGPCNQHSAATRLVPFQFNTTQNYVLEFGNLYMRVLKDGGYVTETAVNITAATQANPVVATATGHGYANGDVVYIAGIAGMTELNGRFCIIANQTANTFELTDQITGVAIDSSAYTAYSSGGTAARLFTLTTPYVQADLLLLKYVQSADIMTLVHPSYDARELSRTAHDAWSLSVISFAPNIAAPTDWALGSGPGAGTYDYYYKFTAVDAVTFEESLPQSLTILNQLQLSTTNNMDLQATTPVTGALKYNIYKLDNANGRGTGGLYGFIGSSENLFFIDDNIDPDTSLTPPTARDPITSADTRPAAVSYYEQRRVFGGSNNSPDTSYFTQIGNTKNLNISSPSRDDDAITVTLNARQVNEIRHYVPMNDLLVLTSGAEWRVNGGPDSGFSISTLRQKPQSYWGSSHIEPIVVGNSVIFIQESGKNVRNLGYSLEVDGYDGGNLTILVEHFFEETTITDWAYAQAPGSIIWCILADGTALSLTYDKEQNVIGWCRHETDGFFESVTSVYENGEDAVYFVVRRTVDGNTVRYVERLKERYFSDVQDSFFVDSGLTLDSPLTITGATQANPVVVTASSHGFANGDSIDIVGVLGMTELNGLRFTAANVTANTFELTGIDGTAYTAYSSAGEARKAVSSITGLEHIEGKAVAILADGNVISNKTVSGGSVALTSAASRVHVGLSYTSDVETLNMEMSGRDLGTLQGKQKKINEVTIKFLRSRGLFIGPTFDSLTEIKWRENELMGAPTDLFTGDKRQNVNPSWDTAGRVAIRQPWPLPMEIQAIIPKITIGG